MAHDTAQLVAHPAEIPVWARAISRAEMLAVLDRQAAAGLVDMSYDDDTDTLMIDLFGAPRAAISVPADEGGHAYLRVDADTGEVVGMQLEDFVSVIVVATASSVNAASMIEEARGWEAKPRENWSPEQRSRAVVEFVRPILSSL